VPPECCGCRILRDLVDGVADVDGSTAALGRRSEEITARDGAARPRRGASRAAADDGFEREGAPAVTGRRTTTLGR